LTLKWNQGVHNYMVYGFGDIPVGAYDSTRLSNIGIGHGGIDGGAGYTYLNPATGIEFSGITGFTYNFKNTTTQYQNGIDFHFDWVHRTFCPNNSLSAWSDMPTSRSLTMLARHRSSTDSNRAFLALAPNSAICSRLETSRDI
jgi:hypothetical protein